MDSYSERESERGLWGKFGERAQSTFNFALLIMVAGIFYG